MMTKEEILEELGKNNKFNGKEYSISRIYELDNEGEFKQLDEWTVNKKEMVNFSFEDEEPDFRETHIPVEGYMKLDKCIDKFLELENKE